MAAARHVPRPDQPMSEDELPACDCSLDPFAELPPELRPKPASPMSGFRKVTCPGCGLVFWSNRSTDCCLACETKGVHRSQQNLTREE